MMTLSIQAYQVTEDRNPVRIVVFSTAINPYK